MAMRLLFNAQRLTSSTKMADSHRGNVGKRRPPQKGQKRRNDIYVNRKTDFAAQLEGCQKLLDSSEQEVRIHGLGAAINRAINLALQLEQRGQGTVELSTTTSSVKLIDDFEPEDDDHEGYSKVRTNSAVHIRVYKKPILPVNSEGTSKNAT